MMHLPAAVRRTFDIGVIVVDEEHRLCRIAETRLGKIEDCRVGLDQLFRTRHHDIAKRIEYGCRGPEARPEFMSEIGDRE